MMEFLVTRGAAEEVIAEVRSVHVIVDPRTQRPIPIPEFFRRAVLAFEGSNVAERAPA
jgi:acyl-CoA thioesterase FadM